jgi:hypothetical protein
MGAINFIEVVRGCDSPEDAYKEAVQQALYDCGHDPYNGTISTTRGFKFLGEIEKNDVEDYIDQHTDDFDKWEACGCIKSEKDYIFFGWAAC